MTKVYIDEREEPIMVTESISEIYDAIVKLVEKTRAGGGFSLSFIPLHGINGEIYGIASGIIRFMEESKHERQ